MEAVSDRPHYQNKDGQHHCVSKDSTNQY